MALAVGDGRVSSGKSSGIISWGAGGGEGIPLQRKQDGGKTLLGTTCGSIEQVSRKTFCALKHTRSSHYPAIYLDSGLSFDASLEVFWGRGPGVGSNRWQGTVVGGGG